MSEACASGGRILLAFALLPAPALAEPAILLHAVGGLESCGTLDISDLACTDLVTELRSPPGMSTVYVIAAGVDSTTGAQFGISYPPSMDILDFGTCHNGVAIAEPGWPATETAVAIAFVEPIEPTGADLVLLARFFLDTGSEGELTLTHANDFGDAAWVNTSFALVPFDDDRLGSAWIAGDSGSFGCNPCDPTTRFELLPDANGLAPDWGVAINALDHPLAVATIVCDDCGEPTGQPDPSGGAIAYVANKDSYTSIRVSREGVPLRADHLDSRHDYSTVVDNSRNRENLLTTAPAGAGIPGRAYHAGNVVGGNIPVGNQGWIIAGTDPSHVDCRDYAFLASRNGNLGDEIHNGAVRHHATRNFLFTASKNFTFPAGEGRFEIGWTEDTSDITASFSFRQYNVTVDDILDAQLGSPGMEENIFVLATRLSSGYTVVRSTVDMSGMDPILASSESAVRAIDLAGTETSAVMAIDASDNVVVAISTNGASSSSLTLLKLASTDLSNVWTPIVWTVGSVDGMELLDIDLDASGNIFLAGRFEGEAAVVRFPALPADETDRLAYWVAGGCVGQSRALDLDSEESCLYATGDCDHPDDSTSETQMFVISLDATDLEGHYEHFLNAGDVPTYQTGIGGAGVAITSQTDPYNDVDPAPYVYALGKIRHFGEGSSSAVLLRYNFGSCTTVGVDQAATAPGRTDLLVSGGRAIRMELSAPQDSDIIARVFDVAGRRCAEMVLEAGSREAILADLGSGVYFVRARVSGRDLSRRALVLR